jgi:hypothetical protein
VLACTPHPGLGTARIERPALVRVVDLATCRERTFRRPPAKPTPALASPDGRFAATVRRTGENRTTRDTIWVTDRRAHGSRPVYSTHVWGATTGLESPGPIVLVRWSGDDRWIFFAVDPGSSASIAADGLLLRVVSAREGRMHRIAPMLLNEDYLAWCGGRLVLTVGQDREAMIHKRLEVAAPPEWKPHPLAALPGRAWGSIACAPDARSVVVQSQPAEAFAGFFATRWQLWRVGLDGQATQLTQPPPGYADESPFVSADHTVYFVRSKHGRGKLFALRHRRLVGPLLSLGYQLGYYGHQSWGYTITRR